MSIYIPICLSVRLLLPASPLLSCCQVVRLTWQREGLRGFYKGLGPALLRVMPQSAVTLVAYEHILRLLDAASSREAAAVSVEPTAPTSSPVPAATPASTLALASEPDVQKGQATGRGQTTPAATR
ncbi:hypothetical protein Vretimale_2400 [Volvox reticuliferus]|nr:hypothetical protein Vretimale_2400 [Volvox reticuliferus]